MTVTKDMTINQILNYNQDIAPILLQAGMHCLGCPSAQAETLAQACNAHNIDCEKILSDINKVVNND